MKKEDSIFSKLKPIPASEYFGVFSYKWKPIKHNHPKEGTWNIFVSKNSKEYRRFHISVNKGITGYYSFGGRCETFNIIIDLWFFWIWFWIGYNYSINPNNFNNDKNL